MSTDAMGIFINSLREKQTQTKNHLITLVNALSLDNQEEKIKYTNLTLEKANELKSFLSPQNVPIWLTKLVDILTGYLNKPNQGFYLNNHQLLLGLIDIYPIVITYRWMPDDIKENLGIDFDKIYQKCKAESKVDSLFDEIIDLLTQIVGSNELDSRKVEQSIKKVLATLGNHNGKSYFDMIMSYDFLQSLFTNILFEELETIPAIGPIIKALRKTVDEAKKEIDTINIKIKEDISTSVKTEMTFITFNNINQIS